MEPILNRLWPFVSAGELVRETIRAPRVLDEIAHDILDPDERSLLTRQRSKPGPLTEEVWYTGDAQLLDEAQFLISGPPRTYGHVVVDEVQDLSPMQLRMVARRAPGGSLTLLGDLAQATGAWAPTDWNDVLRQLPSPVEPRRATLGFAYRTPRPIMEIADRLLEMIAPGTPSPEAVRPGGAPRVIQAQGKSITSTVVGEMLRTERLPGTTAVIAPEEHYEAIQTAARTSRVKLDTSRSSSGHALALLTPREAKGLEFDQVIVVEPIALLVRGLEGLRQLYVAITRATESLTIIHTGELPSVLGSSSV
jgi:DNA helicase IV